MDDAKRIAAQDADDGKRCFTYCGDDACNCSARNVLEFIAPALPVLESVCRKIGLDAGERKAAEMSLAVRAELARIDKGSE